MKEKYNKTAVILAGGKGSRMGYLNKGQLKYRGKTFIQHLLDKLENYAEIIIISNTDLKDIKETKVVQDEVKEIGPLGGIYTGLLHSRYDEVLILSCDTPFIEKPYIDYLGNLSGDYDIALTTCGRNYEPLVSLYRKSLLKDIEKLMDDSRYKISLLFEDKNVLSVDIKGLESYEKIKESMKNINTLTDLRSAGGSI